MSGLAAHALNQANHELLLCSLNQPPFLHYTFSRPAHLALPFYFCICAILLMDGGLSNHGMPLPYLRCRHQKTFWQAAPTAAAYLHAPRHHWRRYGHRATRSGVAWRHRPLLPPHPSCNGRLSHSTRIMCDSAGILRALPLRLRTRMDRPTCTAFSCSLYLRAWTIQTVTHDAHHGHAFCARCVPAPAKKRRGQAWALSGRSSSAAMPPIPHHHTMVLSEKEARPASGRITISGQSVGLKQEAEQEDGILKKKKYAYHFKTLLSRRLLYLLYASFCLNYSTTFTTSSLYILEHSWALSVGTMPSPLSI